MILFINLLYTSGFGGNFHLWANEKFGKTCVEDNKYDIQHHNDSVLNGRWEPLSFITGHFGSVTDVRWGVNGNFLITVSKDQTCRIFAPINNNDKVNNSDNNDNAIRW